MADLATQQIVNAGTAPTLDPADVAGDTAAVGSGTDTFLVVKNSGGSALDVTIGSDLVLDSGAPYPAKTVNVAATTGEAWIPLIRDYIETDTPGRCSITYPGGVTGLTVAVVRR